MEMKLSGTEDMASTSRVSGFVDNWQKGKSVTECNLHMLKNEVFTDVTFRLGQEKHVVRAHRYVLVSRSQVFQAMFCGPLAEQGEITISDIEPEIFRDFLRYVYTDDVKINNDNVTGLLYTSRKYNVDGMLNECVNFLQKSLSDETACQIIEECHSYPDLDLMKDAFEFLIKAGRKVIKSSGFRKLCSECIGTFLKSEELKLKEEEIFEATMSWVKEKCQVEGVPVNHQNIQRFLGDFRYEIRFASMSLDFLVTSVGPSEILSDTEKIRIVNKKVLPEIYIAPFKSTPRKPEQQYGPTRTLQRLSSYDDTFIPTGTHAITFSASKNVLLEGCQLYGPYGRSRSQFKISVTLIGDIIICKPLSNRSMSLKGKATLNNILFPDPISLEADSKYTLCVSMEGERTHCGEDGESLVKLSGVNFSFASSTYSDTTTDVYVGQIPGLKVRLPQ